MPAIFNAPTTLGLETLCDIIGMYLMVWTRNNLARLKDHSEAEIKKFWVIYEFRIHNNKKGLKQLKIKEADVPKFERDPSYQNIFNLESALDALDEVSTFPQLDRALEKCFLCVTQVFSVSNEEIKNGIKNEIQRYDPEYTPTFEEVHLVPKISPEMGEITAGLGREAKKIR